MTQVIEVNPLTNENEILGNALVGEDVILIGYGSNAPLADYFATKYKVKCLLVHPVYVDEPPLTRLTGVPRIVITNDDAVRMAFERYAKVVSFPLTKAFPEEEVQKYIEELINTDIWVW